MAGMCFSTELQPFVSPAICPDVIHGDLCKPGLLVRRPHGNREGRMCTIVPLRRSARQALCFVAILACVFNLISIFFKILEEKLNIVGHVPKRRATLPAFALFHVSDKGARVP